MTTAREAISDCISEIATCRQLMSIAVHSEGDSRRMAWENVLLYAGFWSLRHDDNHSTIYMSDEDIEASILEDLIFCEIAKKAGADVYYPYHQLTKHLGSMDSNRNQKLIFEAFDRLSADGMIVLDENENITIPENRLKEAQKISGVFVIGNFEQDIMDNILMVGGEELAADVFEQLGTLHSPP